MNDHYDLLVIGGGSGGVRAARMSAAFGAKVALVEGRKLGGTCVNVGCVPKKLFVYAASFAHAFEDAAGFGWQRTHPAFDWRALVAAKDREIARLNGIYAKLLSDAGVEVVEGWARFVDPHTVAVGDRELRASKILIATGGRPFVPDCPGREHLVTSNEIFSLEALPKRIVIAGGGYIGVEFASVFCQLGVETHLVHRHEALLSGYFDGDVRRHLTQELRRLGVHAHLGRTVARIESRDGQPIAVLDDGTELGADLHLAAVGRRPNTQGLDLDEVGIATDPVRGGVIVDDDFRTSHPHVFAIGDVIDRIQLTPVALAEGMAFARTHFGGQPTSPDYDRIPTAVFSTPQVGTVGLGEEQAHHRGEDCVIYRSTFTPMKATLSGRRGKTLMKLVVCAKSDEVLGVHVVGPDAAEIVQGFAVALKCRATKAQFDQTVGIHPTAAEELVTMRTPAPS